MSIRQSTGRIIIRHKDNVMHITVSNPTAYNAMTMGMWESMASAIEDVDPKTVRVLVIAGDGPRAFISGADISEFATLRRMPEEVMRYDKAVCRAQQAIIRCAAPTIAMVQGICMGGGLALALACDLRYCNRNARFCMPAARMGLGYNLDGVKRMCATLGMARTTDLFLTARTFDGVEAARIGVVHEVFSDEDFVATVQTRIAAVVSNAPLTLRAVRLAMQHLEDGAETPPLDDVLTAIATCFSSRDYEEGQTAFREKRPPTFYGR